MQVFAELVLLVLGAVAVVGSGAIAALIAMQEHGVRPPHPPVTPSGLPRARVP